MSDIAFDLAVEDFELAVGESRSFLVTVNRTNNTTVPPTVTPVDLRLSLTEITFGVKQRRTDAAVLFAKQIGSGITVSGASPGNVCTVALDGTEFAGLAKDEVYDYVVRVKEPSGPTSDVARGRLFVRPAIAITP